MSVGETEQPALGQGQIRVRVAAAGVNRADILQRRGFYPPPDGVRADILGLEFAGEVSELGPGVRDWKPGERCMGLVPGAAYAEEVVLHAREAVPVPQGVSWKEAAAIPEAFMTAHDALLQLGLRTGERILIHAVGSGVGNAALQLALAEGAEPMGTTRSKWKLDRALDEGLAAGVVPVDGEFLKLLGSRPDKILDFVGAAYLGQNLKALRPGGSLIVVGLLGGRKATADLGLILSKRLQLRGTVLRSRPLEEKIGLAQSFRRHVLPLFEKGRLRSSVDSVFPAREAGMAHERMENGRNYGKIVLEW